ncbi:MAG: prepilin peptidase [Planctomycetia bacterium]|nr:prepilin peptidase [Planctomycetia bacterium]
MLTPEKWPLVVVCVGMIVAAVIDGWKFKVPNWLTFPLVILGWVLGAWYTWSADRPPPYTLELDMSNRLIASLIATAVGFGLLLPAYAIGGMGEGDVKMEMGWGAWIGAYFGTRLGLWIIFYSFCVGVIVGGILGLLVMVFSGRFRQHMEHARNILTDLAKEGAGGAAEKAAERKAAGRWTRLPYGIPLCIGNVGYLILLELDQLPFFLQP